MQTLFVLATITHTDPVLLKPGEGGRDGACYLHHDPRGVNGGDGGWLRWHSNQGNQGVL